MYLNANALRFIADALNAFEQWLYTVIVAFLTVLGIVICCAVVRPISCGYCHKKLFKRTHLH